MACLSRLLIPIPTPHILPCSPSVESCHGFIFSGRDAAAAPVTARDRGRRQRRTGATRTHVSATVRDVASGVAPHLMSRSSRPPRPQYTPVSSSEFIQAPQHVSSRSSYPTFLSLQETAWLQLSCAGRGLVDAFRWDTVVRLAARSVFRSIVAEMR